jgi:hypothetical protein
VRQRGRNARTALALVSVGIAKDDRPSPPAVLDKNEKAIWADYVAAMPAGWFSPEARPLLEALCRAQQQLRGLNRAFEAFAEGVPDDAVEFTRYQVLTRLRLALVTQTASLSTKLRLTSQSRYDAESAFAAVRRQRERPALKPWQDDVDEPAIMQGGSRR